MFVKIYTLVSRLSEFRVISIIIIFQLILFAKLTLEDGNRRNNIEKHFSSSGSMQRNSQSRVQNNFVVQHKKHHRPSSQSSNPTSDRPDLSKATNCSLKTKEGKTFLWRIDTQPPSYFFGTIHVPYTRVWNDISHNAKKAFGYAFGL